MFAKGPQPGNKPKDRVRAVFPEAVCKSEPRVGFPSAYFVYVKGKYVAAGFTAVQAWSRAENRLTNPVLGHYENGYQINTNLLEKGE